MFDDNKCDSPMNIAIMTWFQYHNYGTALQVFALYKLLEKEGYASQIINYLANPQKPICIHKDNIFHEAINKGKNRLSDHLYRRYEEPERERKFDDFLGSLKFTSKCTSMLDLEALNDKFDAFICGSDQIWAPSVFDPHYYLDFVRDENKLLAYAPSVGLNSINDKNIGNRIKELAGRFSYISTREKSGSKLIEDLIGKKVETVLDPTLLLTSAQWRVYSKRELTNQDDYLLIYMLGRNEDHWKASYKLAKALNLKVKVIPVFQRDLNRQGCIEEAIGPAEFVSLVDNASFVCTDSFHGLAFSINFEKPFLVFERFNVKSTNNQNSRIYNLLSTLGLQGRLASRKNPLDIANTELDYTKIQSRLEVERRHSFEFLWDALSSIINTNREVGKTKKENIISRSSLCCGCGACEDVCPKEAIEIRMNKCGFYNVSIDNDKCVSCKRCISVCPFVNNSIAKPIKEGRLFSYIDKDSEVLQTSSSGGLGYRMAESISSHGGDVVGCIFDAKEHRARHVIIEPENNNEIEKLKGSKYSQSQFWPIMQEIEGLKQGSIVIGTPCQIAGVRSLLHGKRNDITLVDLICHGVPSYALYRKYLDYLKKTRAINTDESVTTIFRYKKLGWREIYIYNADSVNSFSEIQDKDPYFLSFEFGFCYSKSCYECPWRDKSAADIRLGDYWHRKYSSNNTGISMAVSLTENGEDVLKSLTEYSSVGMQNEPIQDYFDCQQIKNNRRPVFWEEYIQDLNGTKSMEEISNFYIMPFEKRKKIMKAIHKLKES